MRTRRPRVSLPIFLALFLGLASEPTAAIYNSCFSCAAVTIPDLTGGYFLDVVCLYDFGSAEDCFEWGNRYGQGCTLVGVGECL